MSHSNKEIEVIIEIAMNSAPVKYELDKEKGLLYVDRFMNVAMHYPANYGYIPNTLAQDGDSLDALVICQQPLIPGCILKGRVIGALLMEDESGIDEKLIVLPSIKADPFYSNIHDIAELNEITKQKIKHFFEHYKDLEKNKWVKVQNWIGAEEAEKLLAKYTTIKIN